MGGDETRNAQAFRTLSSLVHESDSDSRDSFWLSSSLLAVLVPHSSMAASTVTDPSSQGARRRGTRRGAAAVTPVMTTQAFWDHIA